MLQSKKTVGRIASIVLYFFEEGKIITLSNLVGMSAEATMQAVNLPYTPAFSLRGVPFSSKGDNFRYVGQNFRLDRCNF